MELSSYNSDCGSDSGYHLCLSLCARAPILVQGSMPVKTIKKRRMRKNARSRSLSVAVTEVVMAVAVAVVMVIK